MAMEANRSHMTERILNLTLEIIYLLTGENYIAYKFSDGLVASNLMKTQLPTVQPPSHSFRKNKKVQEVTSEIIELLTGEVPIRCQDGMVYFSMEKWEYLEGHKDLYKRDAMVNRPPLTSPDGSTNTPERCPRPLDSRDYTQEHQEIPQKHYRIPQEHQEIPQTRPMYPLDSTRVHDKIPQARPLFSEDCTKDQHRIPQEYQEEHLNDYKSPVIEDDVIYLRGDEQCNAKSIGPEMSSDPGDTQRDLKAEQEEDEEDSVNYVKIEEDEIPIIVRAGEHDNGSSMEQCGMISPEISNEAAYDSPEENAISALNHSLPYTTDLPSDPSAHGRSFPDHLPLFAQHPIHRGSEPFPYSTDGYCFTKRAETTSHRTPHTTEKPYSCSVCGKCFTQVGYLPLHERTHTGVKPYSCSECGKSFSFNSTLNRHKIVHTGEKPFSCSECGRCFSLNSTLIKHQRTHTGEKPFSCTECGKCFTRRDHLMIHQRTHTGVKPYPCLVCGKSFTRKASLLEHQRTHMGEKQ